MTPRRPIMPVLVGLACSVAFHLTVLVPGFTRMSEGGDGNPRSLLRARFDPEAFIETAPQIALGIDTETPRTSLTWIGYDEYERHMARLSETEQAAFKTESTPPSPASAEPAESEDELEPAEQPTAAAGLLARLEARLEAIRRGEGPPVPQGTGADPVDLARLLAELAEIAAEPVPPRPAGQAAAAPATPAPPTEQPAPTPEPAEVRDLESPATSLEIDWQDIQIGKPLAATGLEVKPRRPEFTLLTRLTAAPANPLVRIYFQADGVPGKAEIVTSSGDARVDEAILNSLYRWRATGKRLEDLGEGQTVPLEIRILLGGK